MNYRATTVFRCLYVLYRYVYHVLRINMLAYFTALQERMQQDHLKNKTARL